MNLPALFQMVVVPQAGIFPHRSRSSFDGGKTQVQTLNLKKNHCIKITMSEGHDWFEARSRRLYSLLVNHVGSFKALHPKPMGKLIHISYK